MLTSELVRARVRGDTLALVALKGRERERALELAEQLLLATDASIGASREMWEVAVRAVECGAAQRILRDGLTKLIEDALEFESPSELDPQIVRRELYVAANASRSSLEPGALFDRGAVLAHVAGVLGVPADTIERSMFADLRGAQILLRREPFNAERLLERYEEAQIQGILLRALRVRVDVECREPAQYRRLFARLKFRRLLYRLERAGAGYRLEIDGPYSLFESVTKYGLALALAWVALRECDSVVLEADVQWGKARRPVTFKAEHHLAVRAGEGATTDGSAVDDWGLVGEAGEVAKLAAAREGPWQVAPATVLLDVPGEGLCVPDLTFVHRESNWTAHVEFMGFWSRDAVWRRVEWAHVGLGAPVLFVVSERLRVSEAVLEGEESAALYSYKGKPSLSRILEKLDALRVGSNIGKGATSGGAAKQEGAAQKRRTRASRDARER